MPKGSCYRTAIASFISSDDRTTTNDDVRIQRLPAEQGPKNALPAGDVHCPCLPGQDVVHGSWSFLVVAYKINPEQGARGCHHTLINLFPFLDASEPSMPAPSVL